jgi:hypothetical protein
MSADFHLHGVKWFVQVNPPEGVEVIEPADMLAR